MTENTVKVNTNVIIDAISQAGREYKVVSCANTGAETTTLEKPTYLTPIFENFPKELTELDQWVVWKAVYDRDRGKWTKPLYNPVTGGYAKTNTPGTWTSFETAKKAYESGNYDGVGFVLTKEDDFSGLDLDHILIQEGIENKAQSIIETMQTYTEKSPSGDGVRMFCIAKLPTGGRKKGNYELYESGRYLTLTGHRMNELGIESRQSEIKKVHSIIFGKPQDSIPPSVSESKDLSDISDSDLLEKMFKSKSGDKIKALFNGDAGDDHSYADASLCSHLAFWTGKDAGRMDSLFRMSGLFREQWDKKHNADGRTYGQMTIDNAITKCEKTYTPPQKRKKKWGGTKKKEPKIPESDLLKLPEPKAYPEIPDNFEDLLLKEIENNKNSVYSDEITNVICKIRDADRIRYQQIRDLLKKQKVSITEYEKYLKETDKELKRQEKLNAIENLDKNKNTLVLRPGNLPAEVEYCQAVLRDNELIFERGNALYRVTKVKESKHKNDKKVTRDKDAYAIELINPAWLKLELSKNIKFVKIRMTTQGPITEPANCNFDIVNTICANSGAWDMPYLSGVQDSPVITADGKIYGKKAGYDHETELLFTRDFKLAIPDIPTKEEVQQARTVIHEILREYRFESAIDYSVAFAAILSSVVRRMIPTCPFFAIDSTTAGSGKTKLADCISIIASGKDPATMNIPPFDDKESEKRYDSVLLNGDPVILLDNIENTVKSERLCTIATQTAVTARILGLSKVATVPSNSLWLMTGNNLKFAGDITRRVLKCRINPGVENPEELSFDKDPVEWVSQNRDEIIRSIITILKAYLNSDDKPAVKPMGSFEVWSNFIRRAVIWMGLADPCLSKQIIQADDDEKNKISGLLEILYDVFQDKEFIVQDMIGTADDDLKSILNTDFQVKGEISSRKIGNFLSKNNGRIENGLCLEKTGEHRTRAKKWRVRITQHVKHTEDRDSETHAELAELPKNITQHMQSTDTTDGKYKMQSYAELNLPPKEDLSEKKETEGDKEDFSFFQNTQKGDRDITLHNSANGINDIENQAVNGAELAKNVTLHNSATQQMDNSDKEISQNSESESSFSVNESYKKCCQCDHLKHGVCWVGYVKGSREGYTKKVDKNALACDKFREKGFDTELAN